MAEFRNIHTRIWKDPWFCGLEAEQKLLFIYLFSNERASVCGMYELPLRFIAFECGLSEKVVLDAFAVFEAAHKAYYRDGVIWVVNLKKYNDSGDNGKIQVRVSKDLSSIPDCELKKMYYLYNNIPYPYGIDTPSKDDPRDRDGEETETDTEKKQTPKISTTSYPGIFTKVTKMQGIPFTETEKVLGAFNTLTLRFTEIQPLVDYLLPFWDKWSKSKTKDGRFYSKTNCTWLYDWAVTGETPTNGNGKPPAEEEHF
ncbi:conserved hypothetical protein [Gammaproteobacteria bacterium]